MGNIGALTPVRSEIMTTAHYMSLSRANQRYYVISGCDVAQTGGGNMSVTVDPGVISYGGVKTTVPGNVVIIADANGTYSRLDVIYVNGSGVATVAPGVPATIQPVDQQGTTNFKYFTEPYPASIPAGVILAIVHVRAAATTVITADINDIASFGWPIGTTAGDLIQVAVGNRCPAIDGSLITSVTSTRPFALEFQFDGSGLDIAAGYRPGLEVPVTGTITTARLISHDGTTGSIVINVYRSTYDNTPTTMTLVDTFSILGSTKSQETGLSISITAGEWITPNVVSCTSLKYVTLSLTVVI